MARPRGRPRYEPTNEERMNVLMWVVAGHTQESIAAQFNRKPSFITRHFKQEWNKGRQQVDGLVVSQLLKRIKAGDTRAIIFYCETRLGWKRGNFVPEESERQAESVESWWNDNGVPEQIAANTPMLPGLPAPAPERDPLEQTLETIYDEEFDVEDF